MAKGQDPRVLIEWWSGMGWHCRVRLRYRIPRVEVCKDGERLWCNLWAVSGPNNARLTRADALMIAEQGVEHLGKKLAVAG